MQCRQISFLLSLTSLSIVVSMGAPAAHASARSLPAAELEPPEYLTPPIQIQLPPGGNGIRKIRSPALEANPLMLKKSNGLALPDLNVSTCTPDPLRVFQANESGAASQFERLRSVASGTVQPENTGLTKARQLRVQATAAWQMGLLTLHGICAALNTADAALWFERAQSLGEPLAPAGLAWCEIEGCKAAANPAAAGKWVALLRNVDAPRALYLQWLMQSRLAPVDVAQTALGAAGNTPSPLPNRQLLASAARQGDTNAQIELGLHSVFLNDLPEALVFFKNAAPKSGAAAINVAVVAERLKTSAKLPPASRSGNGVAVKPQSAAENFEQAQRYHRGQGVPSNYTEAIRLYQLAQNQGSVPAKKMLELIFSRPAPNGQIDLAWMQQLAQVDLSGNAPAVDKGNAKQNLKREPSPLFELVPQQWRKYAAGAVSA